MSKRYASGGGCCECERENHHGVHLTHEQLLNSIQTVVYVISAGAYVKVGIAENVESRLQVLRTHCPLPASLEYCSKPMARPLAKRVEALCAYELADKAVRGEWYECSPEEVIEKIKGFLNSQDADVAVSKCQTQLRLVA